MTQSLFMSSFAPVLALLTVTILIQPAHAASVDRPTLLLPINDGYGVADCLPQGGECALQVANAWCAALGYDHASDIRTTIDSPQSPNVAVTCDP